MKDYQALSDEQLVSLCRKDDEKAWNLLFARYFRLTNAIVSSLHAVETEPEDLVSEGLFGFLSAVYSFQPDASAGFRTYAAVCIKNRIRNVMKTETAKRRVPSRQCVPLETQAFVDDDADPARAAIAKEESAQLIQLIHTTLSQQEQTVFFLRLRGNGYQQIAAKTGLSQKAVDGTLQRAKKKLRAKFSQQVLSQR